MMRRRLNEENGIILPIVLIFTLILMITGLVFVSLGVQENRLVQREIKKRRAFYAAEAGIESGLFRLRALLPATTPPAPTQGELDAIAANIETNPPISGFIFDVKIKKDGDPKTKEIESGLYAGLTAITQGYEIVSEATSTGGNPASAKIIQKVENRRFYLFQFGVFYSDVELELQPGPEMTFKGRVHSNKDIYLDSNSTLKIDSHLTSAGKIIKGSMPEDPTLEGGTVTIKDGVDEYGNPIYNEMHLEGDPDDLWFDSDHLLWKTKAREWWDGNVQDGVAELKLPLPDLANPIDIIKPFDTKPDNYSDEEFEILKKASLYWQADLRILNGVAYLKDGKKVTTQRTSNPESAHGVGLAYWDPDKSAAENPVHPVVTKTFYNDREGHSITVVEIDIEKLMRREELIKAGTAAGGIGGYLCLENGILYVSESGSNKGVRLVNGSQLPSGGLTVGTDNPLYIKGDYNAPDNPNNKQPAAVACDALNILSNSWDDSHQHDRIASDTTTVNVSIATGIVETEQGHYSGGVENLPRFLENWSGKTFKYSGSMVVLGKSEQATGKWIYGMPYYTAPKREWEFDEDVLDVTKLPPATPQVSTVERTHWEQD